EVLDYAAVYGMRVRLSRAAALPKVEGKSATAKEKFEAIRALAEHYLTGTEEWDIAPRATGPRIDEWVLRAIGALKGESVSDVRTRAVEAANARKITVAEVVKAWAAIPKVAEKVNELKAAASG